MDRNKTVILIGEAVGAPGQKNEQGCTAHTEDVAFCLRPARSLVSKRAIQLGLCLGKWPLVYCLKEVFNPEA